MSATRFKIGDIVRVRADLSTEKMYGIFNVIPYMTNFKGQCFKIEKVKKHIADDYYQLDGVFCAWNDEMLEPVIKGGLESMTGNLFIDEKNLKIDVQEVVMESYSTGERRKVKVEGYINETIANPKSLKPLKIYTNEKKRVVVVKWEDGTTTKATCSQDDHFDVTVGFAMCYVKKVYGGKEKLLKKVKKLSK